MSAIANNLGQSPELSRHGLTPRTASMRIRTAVLVSLLVAVAAGFLGYRFVPPIPLPHSPDPEFINALVLGRFSTAVLIASAVYATAVSAIISGAVIGEFVALRRRFAPLETAPDQPIKRRDWEAAFSGSALEPFCYRIVSAKFTARDENLLLAEPFSPSLAREELRGFYPRHLALAQVLTIGLVLPGTIGAAILMAAPLETTVFLVRTVGIAESLLLACVGFGILGISIAIDKLISSIARLHLDVQSRPLPTPSESDGAALERLSTSIAAAIRTEMQPVLARLETTVVQSADSEQRLLERLTETLAATDKTLARSLHSSEGNGAALERLSTGIGAAIRSEMQAFLTRLETLVAQSVGDEQNLWERLTETLAATDRTLLRSLDSSERNGTVLELIRTELANVFGTLPDNLAHQFSAQCEAIFGGSREAISTERDALRGEIASLGHIFSQSAERQLQEVQRVASEHDQAIQYLGDTIRQAYVEGERDRHAAFAKATDLMQSVEAYAASLLPAVKRLEGCEERVASAVAYESETLSRLSVYVKELSGTLEALRVALAHGRNEIASVLVQTPSDALVPIAQENRSAGDTDFSKLASQLYMLLDELEEKAPSA